MTHLHYFPVGIGLATLFAAILLGLFLLLQIGLLSRAYSALTGQLDEIAALRTQAATEAADQPAAQRARMLESVRELLREGQNLPEERIVSREVVEIFGVPFLAPVTAEWPGTILAINVGGAVIPILLSFYLLMRYDLWGFGALATAIVAFVVHRLATPVPGMGISVPTFAPPLLAAVVALALSRRFAAPLAYISGSLGVLIGEATAAAHARFESTRRWAAGTDGTIEVPT